MYYHCIALLFLIALIFMKNSTGCAECLNTLLTSVF